MEVFEFEKTLLTRLQETSDVLGARGAPIPASMVRTEWANYVEIAIEPTGWQALWRIPRVVCEELSIKFPAVVMGTVEQVLFDELKAIFLVEAVQDDDVHLPEKQIVSLEELWPLREQENDALNIDRTSDCIDRLRFFYQHIWMPWDNDNDDDRSDWANKNLESRTNFYYDVKNKTMSKRLSSHVLALLAEANYIQKKRELLEMEIEDEEENENQPEDAFLTHHTKASDLMKLHLRLNSIKNEIDILENPAMREVYEKVRFSDENTHFAGTIPNGQLAAEIFIITHIGTLDQQIQYLSEAKALVSQNKLVRICDSLQGALDRCKPSDELYLPPGTHAIKFLEYLNSGGAIRAISPVCYLEAAEKQKLNVKDGKSIISSKDDDSILLTVDGDYCFENVMLDCSNVRTAVLIKRGNVSFKNCCFSGDPKSTTKQGLVVFGNSTIRLERCIIQNFATGIYSNQNSNIQLLNSVIQNCVSGIEVLHGCNISFKATNIKHCKNYGVILEVDDLNVSRKGESRLFYDDYNQIERKEFNFEGACEFNSNGKANFVVYNSDHVDFNNSCFVEQAAPESPESTGTDQDQSSNVSFTCFYDVIERHHSAINAVNDVSDTDNDEEHGQINEELTDAKSKNITNALVPDEKDVFDTEKRKMQESIYVTANEEISFESIPHGDDSNSTVYSSDYVDDSVAVIEIEDTVIELD